ncbi:hypothetical protein GWI33_007263, partial [Rhynchophorus ferrugineus]
PSNDSFLHTPSFTHNYEAAPDSQRHEAAFPAFRSSAKTSRLLISLPIVFLMNLNPARRPPKTGDFAFHLHNCTY